MVLCHPLFKRGDNLKFWLYQLKGDKRYLDKTSFLTPLYNSGENEYFEGAILDATSVVNPTFKLSRSKYWKKCNYLFCQDTCRYYYVTDVTMEAGYVLVTCHVDVLMTFKNALKNKVVIASRNESKYNVFLNDDKFKSYAPPKQICYEFFPQSERVFSMGNIQYILAIAGSNANNEEEEEE